MKFGVREICDVVLKAKAAQKVGNKMPHSNDFHRICESISCSVLSTSL